jgi:MarR family transcriptional regulator, temperature-dependent positive regulator of motility
MIEDTHYQVLKILEQNPQISQRELAGEMGVSLGKVNYCLKALVDKGLVKAKNFKNSANKRAYFYVLTPRGMEAKAKISVRFLQRKLDEYDALRAEIEELQSELGEQ